MKTKKRWTKHLRKVLFDELPSGDYSMGDKMEDLDTWKVSPEAVRRKGFFHCWGSVHRYNSQKGESYIVMVAIVEDEEGKVREINPNRIKFVETFDNKLL